MRASSSERLARSSRPVCLVVRGLLAVEVGNGSEAAAAQGRITLEIGRRLRKVGAGRGKLGLGAFDLQLQVLRIEAGDDVAAVDVIADIDEAGDDLAGDAESDIGFVASAHDTDEFPHWC